MNVTYEARKAAGICVGCGKAHAEHGVLCMACWQTRHDAYHNNKYMQRHYKAAMRQRYYRDKAAGRCVRCRKADVFPGMTMCGPCAEAARLQNQEYRARKRKEREQKRHEK